MDPNDFEELPSIPSLGRVTRVDILYPEGSSTQFGLILSM